MFRHANRIAPGNLEIRPTFGHCNSLVKILVSIRHARRFRRGIQSFERLGALF
jgi:hypothetical protein